MRGDGDGDGDVLLSSIGRLRRISDQNGVSLISVVPNQYGPGEDTMKRLQDEALRCSAERKVLCNQASFKSVTIRINYQSGIDTRTKTRISRAVP